VAADINSS